MCSLHVLPTIGSNVTVHITSVNLHSDSAFVEFGGTFNHVQLTKEIYQQMKKDIHMHKEKDCKFKGNPGALCLVREEKNCHRARILSRCGDQYNVFLIDDGRTLWASNNIMSWGNTSFFNLPPLMELFILASASPLPPENRWSPTASKFLKSLTGKTVSGCVQDVMMPSRMILLDIPSVFKQMHEFGFARKIPCGQFQILVEDSLHSPRDVSWPGSPLTNVQIEFANKIESCHQFLCPELMPGTIETVEVTHVVNPFTVFCKLQVFSHELKRLNKQIQEYCENTSALMPTPLSDGCPCATKGSDGMWYRSVWQKHVMSDVAKVFHVDYGREDFVKLKDVRPLSAEFFRLPVVTYACSLYGIKDKGTGWTTSQIDWLKSILLDQILVGKFEHRSLADGIYHVTLYGNNNVNINNSFAVHEKCSIMSERDSFCSKETPKNSLELSTMEDSPEDLKSTYQGLHSDFSNPFEGHSVLNEHLFTIGTVVEVNVSYVESDQTFWCQMADSVPSLKMLMEDLQRHYSCSQFQMLIGSICVACHPNNGMWYRAHVLNHQLNSSQVDVRLIDYGQRLKVPLQDLRPIDSEFLKLKRQAFQCSLFNKVNSVSSEDTALSDSAFSDSFDLISSASLDNATLKFTICAVMYDPQGTMLNVVDIESLSPNCRTALIQKEANSSAVDSLDTHCVLNSPQADSSHHINLHTKEKVWITCVKGVDHFYGQFKPNAAMVEKLTKDIQQFCGMTHPKGNNFLPQMMCIARYKDGQLYRGQIKSVNPKIIVHFVDYGDLLILDESDLLPFPAEPSANMSLPFQAVKFSLFNVSLEESTTELNAWFESYATDRMFTATIMGKGPNGELLVEMHDGKTNINVKAKEKWNEIQNKECNARIQDINQLSHGLVKPLGRRDNSNSNLQADQGYRKAQKSADHTSFTGHNVKNVQCTDFAVCTWDTTVTSVPSVKCVPKVTDLPPTTFEQDCVSEVYISHIISPNSFFVQLAKDENGLVSLTEELNSISSSVNNQAQMNYFPHGSLVKAVFPDDNSWYRAVIKEKNGKDIHVEFIDFGNEATVPATSVRKLEEQFLQVPRFSIHCSLKRDHPTGILIGMEKETCPLAAVLKKAGEKRLFCKFIKKNKTVWEVNLADQRSTLDGLPLEIWDDFSTLQNDSPKQDMAFKKPEISVGQTVEAYASSMDGPNYFWCQGANSEGLDTISLIAQEAGNSAEIACIQIDELCQGDPCLALFTDKLWYRAKVIKKSQKSVSVLFVDYGNESENESGSVKPLPLSLLERPLQAFLCQLEGFSPSGGSWNSNATDKFWELVVDKPLTLTVTNIQNDLDSPFPSYCVKVQSQECVVNEQMKSFWTAAVCPNDESPKLPLSNADTVPVVCNVQSVPEKRLHEIYDNSQENIKTLSDFKPQSFSPFEKQEQEETFRQIVHIKEECEEIEVTQRTLATRDVCLINGDESSLALDKCVSKSKDEFRGINVKCSSKSFQNGQLDNLLPCVGMSETASSNECDQTLVNQENSDVPYSQADLGKLAIF
ncbi:tudor domain-containing protein 6-like [Astyanax mexicanus]|uniref:Tudor domain-containing protein 6-like n=1 Tax=Astyanax mexicanus TaxID=7994 RepID=A0A8T2LH65_ASTMX|nr:tudor domain-containing protein 6-like [Astyanax mexicanus]